MNDGDGDAVRSHTVRDATLRDLAAVRDVYRRSSLSNHGDRAALLAHPELLVWPSAGISSGRTRVVTDAAGDVIGFATLAETSDGLELEDLFVDPDRTRAGVGRLLIADALETAARLERASIEVTANPNAAEFYEAVGFVAVGTAATRFGPALRLRLLVGAQR